MCIFAVASTIWCTRWDCTESCELLQNVYLCSSKHNNDNKTYCRFPVVNCFKMCIFAVASTIPCLAEVAGVCCELLQNVYLCSSKHNEETLWVPHVLVVNCFKMCIFAVASTIHHHLKFYSKSVVNCFKMCIFAVASTITKENLFKHFMLWIASKCVSLQ